MSIGVIGKLEVVHIQHKQGSMLQLLWFGEKCFAFPLECLTVVEPGQCIIISLMLDTKPFQGSHRDVLDQPELSLIFLPDLHTEVTGFSVWPCNAVDPSAAWRGRMRAGCSKGLQPFLKLDRCQCSRLLTVHTEHGKEIIGKIHTAGVKADFIAAEFDTGHIHDPQKLCRGHQNIPA